MDMLTSTGTRASWSVGTGPRLSGSLDTSMLRRCAPLRVRVNRVGGWAPSVVAALNGEVTRLTGKKPSDAIKAKTVAQKPSSVVPDRPVGLKEQRLPSGVGVRYLHQPGELEGGRRRATDPVWSLTVHRLGRSVTKPGEPVFYYLQDGPPRGFVREQGGTPRSAARHSASSGWGSQALSAAAPLFRLHSRQVSLTLSWMWPAELSNRSTLNCWVSFGWQAHRSSVLDAAQRLFWASFSARM